MKVVHTLAELRQLLPAAGACAFVPTMGNLHDGHLALVRQARTHGLPVAASIFVNRLQFAPHEDFDRYPRTLQADCGLLQEHGCDLVFAPDEREMYPQPQRFKVTPDPALADILEGHFRPGFFVGVGTVVLKLFNMVRPRVAVFGKKDYQQLMVIRRMVQQFALSIDVEAVDTARAADGLALSSRNAYLADSERAEALSLSHALEGLARAYLQNPQDLSALEAAAVAKLRQRGWHPDYLTVRQRNDLLSPTLEPSGSALTGTLVALGAARLGATRLIDNLEF